MRNNRFELLPTKISYATRENEIDRMLRAGLFVDLYAVVRQAIRASVESYSIKDLEPLYDFKRSVPLPDARKALASGNLGSSGFARPWRLPPLAFRHR